MFTHDLISLRAIVHQQQLRQEAAVERSLRPLRLQPPHHNATLLKEPASHRLAAMARQATRLALWL